MNDDVSKNFVWLAAFALLGLFILSPGWLATIVVLFVLYISLVITNTMAREENRFLREARRDQYRKHFQERQS